MKRKPARRTIPDVRRAPPRPLAPCARPAARPYPRCDELLASSTEWRRTLEHAFLAALRPAAVAGAVGLAAATGGCAGPIGEPVRAELASWLSDGEALAAPDASPAGDAGGIVMFPVDDQAVAGGGGKAGDGLVVAHPLPLPAPPPSAPPSGGSGIGIDHPLPGPSGGGSDPDPGVASIRPKPPVITPQGRPPLVRGGVSRVRPRPDPPPVPGGIG